jgi:hypothetical protein
MDSIYVPAKTAAVTFRVAKPLLAVDVSRVIPALLGLEIEVLVNRLLEPPLVVEITVLVDLPTDVVIEVALLWANLNGATTVIVTTLVTVSPRTSIAVKVSTYVPPGTNEETLIKAELAVLVSIVIPELAGDTECVKVLFPIPPVAVYARDTADDPTLVVSVKSPDIARAVEY